MLTPDQLTPEEAQSQNQPLIQDLGHYYDTRSDDAASMERMRARFLQKASASLPAASTGNVTPFPTMSQTPSQEKRGMKIPQRVARHPYLNTLAAAVLLVVLVGASVLALQLRQGTSIGSDQPTIAHDWSIIARFSGTGNRTLTGLNIDVGNKYGWLINCTNTSSGLLSLKLNGQESGDMPCSTKTVGPLAPIGSYTSPAAYVPPIYSIEVTAPASTSWDLLLFKGVYYPPLSIDKANWQTLHEEIDGTGSTTWSGIDATLPKTWGLVYTCHGTGTFKVSLWSNAQPASPDTTPDIIGFTDRCDGQPRFNQMNTIGEGKIVHQILITTGANNDWQFVLVGCTNGRPSCGVTTVPATSTP